MSSDQASGRGHDLHWLVLETRSNQAYVFASNKQAINVGASQIIWQAGTEWVDDAVRQVSCDGSRTTRVETIVKASGKALLLVDGPETGRAVIRAITRRALAEAPGLEVWGIVDPAAIGADEHVGVALARAHRLHAAWRCRRPASQLRHPTLPFVQPCRYSGQPVTDLVRLGGEAGSARAAARIARALAARDAGRARMADRLGDRAVVRPSRLNDGVSHAGWVAVVHADGNGIGELFRNLYRVYAGDQFLDRLRALSEALDEVTFAALRQAVAAQPDQADWLLPLVVGGDDVTVVIDARVAFDLTTGFLREFAKLSATDSTITEVVARVSPLLAARPGVAGHDRAGGLTACAGIAYVKPHYAFSDAYRLAEELCASAKRVKNVDPRYSALDFQVLHDSVGRNLDRLRAPSTVPAPDGGELHRWAGPVVVTGDEVGPVTGWADTHHERRLREAMAALRTDRDDPPPAVTRSGLHQLRQVLLQGGGAGIARARKQVIAWAPDAGKAHAFLEQHLCIPEPSGGDPAGAHYFTRIVGAVDLLDMETGTAAGTRQPHETAEPETVTS